jgi:hypothetical protein
LDAKIVNDGKRRWDLPRLGPSGKQSSLLYAVYEAARAAGSSRVYWQTKATNAPGRALYDKLAEHQGFIVMDVIALLSKAQKSN